MRTFFILYILSIVTLHGLHAQSIEGVNQGQKAEQVKDLVDQPENNQNGIDTLSEPAKHQASVVEVDEVMFMDNEQGNNSLLQYMLIQLKRLPYTQFFFAILLFHLGYFIFANRRIRRKNRHIETVNAELSHLNAHLEFIVDARTKELKQALKRAEESDKLKSAFLANMSHEIRTPLNGLIGFARLLDDDNLPSHIRKQYIEIIALRGNNLTRIINDIISISQIEVGQLEIKKSAVNINRLLASLFTMFDAKEISPRKEEVKLNLVRSLSDSRSKIITDPIRLEQILFNLIDNALKFTHEGVVEFGYQLDNSKNLKFFVQDTGIGIPKELQGRIFTRFNRFESPYISSASGPGLGLSICKGLVELLDGKIWFESIPEKGTTFYFTIPYFAANEEESAHNYFSGNVDFSGKVILVVEDDLISYQLVEALLKDTNAKLIHVKNGEDAVEVCQLTSNIDLVLMDMRLPFLNGYEATSRIKKINPKLTVIAQTANVLCDDRSRCIGVGCSDYIAKPIDPDEFMRTISSYLLDPVSS